MEIITKYPFMKAVSGSPTVSLVPLLSVFTPFPLGAHWSMSCSRSCSHSIPIGAHHVLTLFLLVHCHVVIPFLLVHAMLSLHSYWCTSCSQSIPIGARLHSYWCMPCSHSPFRLVHTMYSLSLPIGARHQPMYSLPLPISARHQPMYSLPLPIGAHVLTPIGTHCMLFKYSLSFPLVHRVLSFRH